MTWYYVKDGEAAGPISDEEFLSKLRIGSILPTTLVWRSGMADWQSASKVAPEIVLPAPATNAFSPYLGESLTTPRQAAPGAPPVLPHFFCTFCGNIIPADQLVRISGRAVCGACKPVYVQQASEGLDAPVKAPIVDAVAGFAAAAPETDLADPSIRLVAHILDLLFIGVPMMIVVFIFFLFLGVVVSTGKQNPTSEMTIGFMTLGLVPLAFVWTFSYWTFFLGRKGVTPGMKIMKVKMVRSDRGPLGYGRAFGRTILLYVINAFTMSLTNLTAFFDKERRTVVDMICDTRVVRS